MVTFIIITLHFIGIYAPESLADGPSNGELLDIFSQLYLHMGSFGSAMVGDSPHERPPEKAGR